VPTMRMFWALRPQDALIEGSRTNAGLFHSGASVRGRRVLRRASRVAQAILKTIPGAHARRKPSWNVVSIQAA